jgi:hypothetical protein
MPTSPTLRTGFEARKAVCAGLRRMCSCAVPSGQTPAFVSLRTAPLHPVAAGCVTISVTNEVPRPVSGPTGRLEPPGAMEIRSGGTRGGQGRPQAVPQGCEERREPSTGAPLMPTGAAATGRRRTAQEARSRSHFVVGPPGRDQPARHRVGSGMREPAGGQGTVRAGPLTVVSYGAPTTTLTAVGLSASAPHAGSCESTTAPGPFAPCRRSTSPRRKGLRGGS